MALEIADVSRAPSEGLSARRCRQASMSMAAARILLFRPPHRKRSELGRGSGSAAVSDEGWQCMAAWKQPQRQRPRTKLPPVETSPDGPDSSTNSQNYPSISTPKVEGLALVSRSRTAFQFQHAKRPPARGQRALAFSSFQRGSALRQLVEQAGLKRLQGPLLLAKEVSLRLARALSSERVAAEGVVGLRPAQASVSWRVFHRKNRMRSSVRHRFC